MTPDINLKGYYLEFIRNSDTDAVKYKDLLNTTNKIIDETYEYIVENKLDILNVFGINFTDFDKEYNKDYDKEETLYKIVIKLLSTYGVSTNRILLIQLVKLCTNIKLKYKYTKLIDLSNKRKNIKFTEFSKYVTKYYNKVHEKVLNGMGYKFSGGIGTYCINRWMIDPTRLKKTKQIDFAATNARKREIIANGQEPYDDNMAAWYKARNIPYHGVEYRVYKNESSFYEFTFIKSKIFKYNTYNYKRTEYVGAKYRGMSYKDIADKCCDTIDKVYSLQVDIKYKLNILLHKNPAHYLKFVRNAEQYKHKAGAHNS